MKYFRMSRNFDKSLLSDFDLYEKNNKYYDKEDNSEWKPCFLYDFGWGKEYGFYRVPLGDFNDLMKFVLNSSDIEDSYAAASIILDNYGMELKNYLINLINMYNKNIDYKKLNSIFKLSIPLNRTIEPKMNLNKIKKEYLDWKKISLYFEKIK